jgi:hypothetical protein
MFVSFTHVCKPKFAFTHKSASLMTAQRDSHLEANIFSRSCAVATFWLTSSPGQRAAEIELVAVSSISSVLLMIFSAAQVIFYLRWFADRPRVNYHALYHMNVATEAGNAPHSWRGLAWPWAG